MRHIDPAYKPSEGQYLNCIRCGLCLAVCPTYREQLNETASPRGRVALARKELEGGLAPSPNLLERMYACFGCMACDSICPVGIRPAELALDMRTWHEQQDRSQWKQALFGEVLTDPGRMEFATLPLRWVDRLGLRGLGIMLPAKLRDIERMLPPLPRRPLRQSVPEISEPMGEAHYRVGFFLGCAQSLLFASQSAATIRVLQRNGCTVVTPRQTVCCGMPAGAYGRIDLVVEQALHNIALFESAGVDLIVTDCATCGSTLKGYGHLLEGMPAWAERAGRFSDKVRDVSEFLGSLALVRPTGRLRGRVTYHDPCHLRRGQGVWQQPRHLLRMIDGLEFVELPEADWCCGSAGSQLITHHETSLQVLKRKMSNLEGTQADYVASGCPGCQMQLNVGVRRGSLGMEVVHPIQLLDRAYSV